MFLVVRLLYGFNIVKREALVSLEEHFSRFRSNIVGIDATMPLSDGTVRPIVYADWTASGRLYRPLEDFMLGEIGPLVANTHTETTYTGTAMTHAYHEARDIIKKHVGASSTDSLLFSGSGMTAAINKLQRMLGLRVPAGCTGVCRDEKQRPLVIVTHLEHHSNQITWEECDADVVLIQRDAKTGLPDLYSLESILKENIGRSRLIGAFSACSNVTGIITPYHEMAALMHKYGGLCFIDFAASAPYVDINMHPENPEERLDAITFSPHKFLGGPGTSGVLVLSNKLYTIDVPDQPGGGTVKWTTPFGTHAYVDEIEAREDGGTPGFLQAIRTALAIKIKDEMGTKNILDREKELKKIFLAELSKDDRVFLLEPQNLDRLGIISLFTPGTHHNLVVKLLNDRYGIQTRGGCSCAGTYGHILFKINQATSCRITDMIDSGDLTDKPGWVRVSLHPTMTDAEARYVGRAVCEIVQNYKAWGEDYVFHKELGEFYRKDESDGSAVSGALHLLERFKPA